MRCFGLFVAALAQNNETDGDIIVLENIQQYIDESLIGARGLGGDDSNKLQELSEFQGDLMSIARRREEQAVELGLTVPDNPSIS